MNKLVLLHCVSRISSNVFFNIGASTADRQKGTIIGIVVAFVVILIIIIIFVVWYRRHLKKKYAKYLEPKEDFVV